MNEYDRSNHVIKEEKHRVMTDYSSIEVCILWVNIPPVFKVGAEIEWFSKAEIKGDLFYTIV